MADENEKSYLIGMKFGTRGFFKSLITNLSSKFRNSKWRIQYGERKCKKLLDAVDIWYSVVFGVADYESELKIHKFKIADPIYLTKMQKGKIYAAEVFLRHTFFR